jgi:hypothetical protein
MVVFARFYGELRCRPELLDHVAPHGDADGEFVPDAVVTKLQLEGIEQSPLAGLWQRGEFEGDSGQLVDQARVGCLGIGFGSASSASSATLRRRALTRSANRLPYCG